MRILVIEDEKRIAQNIKYIFYPLNYVVDLAFTGEDGLFKAESEDCDLIILDWMLSDISGIEICKILRKKNITTPILMLTAKSQLDDKVEGLEVGADDYLTKPFAIAELIARAKALIRRKSGGTQSPVITVADLTINTNTCIVKRKNKLIELAPKEYALLEFLAVNKGKVINRTELLNHVWGEEIDPMSNTIDVHIRYLRVKIDDPFKIKLLKTVKNKGYMLCIN